MRCLGRSARGHSLMDKGRELTSCDRVQDERFADVSEVVVDPSVVRRLARDPGDVVADVPGRALVVVTLSGQYDPLEGWKD